MYTVISSVIHALIHQLALKNVLTKRFDSYTATFISGYIVITKTNNYYTRITTPIHYTYTVIIMNEIIKS